MRERKGEKARERVGERVSGRSCDKKSEEAKGEVAMKIEIERVGDYMRINAVLK